MAGRALPSSRTDLIVSAMGGYNASPGCFDVSEGDLVRDDIIMYVWYFTASLSGRVWTIHQLSASHFPISSFILLTVHLLSQTIINMPGRGDRIAAKPPTMTRTMSLLPSPKPKYSPYGLALNSHQATMGSRVAWCEHIVLAFLCPPLHDSNRLI